MATNQTEVWGAFRAGRRAQSHGAIGRRRRNVCVTLTAEHDGYRNLVGRPVHRRRLLIRAAEIEIADDVLGTGMRTRCVRGSIWLHRFRPSWACNASVVSAQDGTTEDNRSTGRTFESSAGEYSAPSSAADASGSTPCPGTPRDAANHAQLEGLDMKQLVQSVRSGCAAHRRRARPGDRADRGARAGPTIRWFRQEQSGRYRELASASLLRKAKARPDLVRQIARKARAEGLRATFDSVQARLDDEMPLGYSAAGLVLEVGEAVSGVHPGMRVATGGAGHADLQVVAGNLTVPIPENVELSSAAFATVAAIALHGLRQAEVGPGGKVCVIGLGLIGQLTCGWRLRRDSTWSVSTCANGRRNGRRRAVLSGWSRPEPTPPAGCWRGPAGAVPTR